MTEALRSRCRVVLVRPHYAANIGSTARVMRNFGLSQLTLVSPLADPLAAEARRLSTHGEAILHTARFVSDLSEAITDCVWVAATSASTAGPFRTQSQPLDEQMPILVEALAVGPAAVVFGPEPSGLTNTEIACCHGLIHIPTAAEYPALNLAQAVAITLYELHRAANRLSRDSVSDEDIADWAEQERLFAHLREGLEAIHFLYGPKADTLMHALRQLIGRARPTSGEIRILHGLARQMLFVGRGGSPSSTFPCDV